MGIGIGGDGGDDDEDWGSFGGGADGREEKSEAKIAIETRALRWLKKERESSEL